ncbi:MAG: ABC transporter ATP-binding protein [Thermoprotei archaeon]
MNEIDVRELTKSYGKYKVLKGVTFSVPKGSVTGFVGPNGAGKTTTIKALATLIRPDSGEVKLLGRNPFRDVSVMSRVSFVFTRLLYPSTDTVLEYLNDQASLYGGDVRRLVDDFDLKPHLRKKLSELSSGLAQRVQLAAALLKNPEVIIADEPAANLDPQARNELYERIKELNRKGVTFFISSHILSELERLVDRVVFISEGRITFEGPLNRALEGKDEVYLLVSDPDRAMELLRQFNPRREGAYLVVGADLGEAVSLLEGRGVKVIIARRSSLDEAFKRYNRGEAG